MESRLALGASRKRTHTPLLSHRLVTRMQKPGTVRARSSGNIPPTPAPPLTSVFRKLRKAYEQPMRIMFGVGAPSRSSLSPRTGNIRCMSASLGVLIFNCTSVPLGVLGPPTNPNPNHRETFEAGSWCDSKADSGFDQ